MTAEEASIPALFHFLDGRGPYRLPPGELSVAIVSDTVLANLHERFLQDPTPTDVITFPGDVADAFAGEICASADRAHALSTSHEGLPFAEELTLYLVHGWLHLAGLDDHEASDRKQMRAAEEDLLRRLREHSRIPSFTWVECP